MDIHVENEPNDEGIDKEERMPENDWSSESGYSEPTHDEIRRLIYESFKEQKERRLWHLIGKWCKKMVIDLFE